MPGLMWGKIPGEHVPRSRSSLWSRSLLLRGGSADAGSVCSRRRSSRGRHSRCRCSAPLLRLSRGFAAPVPPKSCAVLSRSWRVRASPRRGGSHRCGESSPESSRGDAAPCGLERLLGTWLRKPTATVALYWQRISRCLLRFRSPGIRQVNAPSSGWLFGKASLRPNVRASSS